MNETVIDAKLKAPNLQERLRASILVTENGKELPDKHPVALQTTKGSTYFFLENGQTLRYKKAMDEWHEPQAAIVFIPDYQSLKVASKGNLQFDTIFGSTEADFSDRLSNWVYGGSGVKVRIVDEAGHPLESNDVIKRASRTFLKITDSQEAVISLIPVSPTPKIGYLVFETTKFKEQDSGRTMRRKHLGNQVVSIFY